MLYLCYTVHFVCDSPKAQPINMATLCWMFIGSALCYAYAVYVILCALTAYVLLLKFFVCHGLKQRLQYAE